MNNPINIKKIRKGIIGSLTRIYQFQLDGFYFLHAWEFSTALRSLSLSNLREVFSAMSLSWSYYSSLSLGSKFENISIDLFFF